MLGMKKMLLYILVVCAAVFASEDEGVSSLDYKLANRSVSEDEIMDRVRELSSESRSSLVEMRMNHQTNRMERMEGRLEFMCENKMMKIREDKFRPREQVKIFDKDSQKWGLESLEHFFWKTYFDCTPNQTQGLARSSEAFLLPFERVYGGIRAVY